MSNDSNTRGSISGDVIGYWSKLFQRSVVFSSRQHSCFMGCIPSGLAEKREKWKWKKRLAGLAGAGPGRSFSFCLILLFHNLVVFSRIAFVFYTVHNIGFGFLMRSFVLSLISFVASLFSHFDSTFLDLGVEWFRFLFYCLSFH